MATHSSMCAWRIPQTEEPVGYSPWGCKGSDMTEATERARTHMGALNKNHTDRCEISKIDSNYEGDECGWGGL